MADIKPYKYQDKLINKRVPREFKKGRKHIIVQSPTGSGKTVMFSFMTQMASKKRNKVLIITDRMELLSQAGGTLEKFDMNPCYIKAGTKYLDKTKNVYVAMAQTLRNRVQKPMWRDFIQKEISLIIIDECHIQEFNYLFKDGFLDNNYVIGFTATPDRNGKMTQLGLQYEAIVKGPPIKKLIKKGFLLNCDIYDCGAPDMSGVEMNRAKGDYAETAMFRKYDNAQLYKGLIKNYQRLTPNGKMIVFCCNVHHAIKTAKSLNKVGIEAKFICSEKHPPKEPRKWTDASKAIFDEKFKAYKSFKKNFYKYSGERKKVFEWFKHSKNGVLVNVDIATKGFDEPSIEVVALYRATTSLTLYLQMIGRGSRIAENKSHFTVLDFGGNKARFGPYDVDRNWSLWHEEKKSEGGVPPMKVCGETSDYEKIKGAGSVKKGCGRLILAAYKLCPFCGFKYPIRDKAKEADLALSKIVDEKGVSIKTKSFKEMTHDELFKYREIKGHQMPWLWLQLWNRGGEPELITYANKFRWSQAIITKATHYCRQVNNR
tara:strand:+ start:607 stop:2235 length:1629 start_codon:yes stop_codon:yes gene_type:complete